VSSGWLCHSLLIRKMSVECEKKKIESSIPSVVVEDFQRARQESFLRLSVQCLPRAYESQDVNHIMIVYYVMHALDTLGLLKPSDTSKKPIVSEKDRHDLIEYVYSLQVHSTELARANDAYGFGFAGAPCCVKDGSRYLVSSAATTFGALCLLNELGDDLSRVDRDSIAEGFKKLQQPNGCFAGAYQRKKLPADASDEERELSAREDVGDCDLRFVFCACASCAMLGDWRGVDKEAATRYVLSCQSYDGAFGQGPLQEGHGGSTFCAVASLALMDKLGARNGESKVDKDGKERVCVLSPERRRSLIRWLVNRQISGFQGRINKPADTCYGFWIGASLAILRSYDADVPPNTHPAEVSFVDNTALCNFLLTCQQACGGFSKEAGTYPDLVHTCLSIVALSIAGFPGMEEIDCTLNITKRAAHSVKPKSS